jgi:hypothetical protein
MTSHSQVSCLPFRGGRLRLGIVVEGLAGGGARLYKIASNSGLAYSTRNYRTVTPRTLLHRRSVWLNLPLIVMKDRLRRCLNYSQALWLSLSYTWPNLFQSVFDDSKCCRVLPEKLTVTQLVNKFPAFYGTRRFITVFTRARHWPLQPTPPHPISPRSILVLFPHLRLGLPNGLFPSGLPTVILYASQLSRACSMPRPSHPFWFDQRSLAQCINWVGCLRNGTTEWFWLLYFTCCVVISPFWATLLNNFVINSETWDFHGYEDWSVLGFDSRRGLGIFLFTTASRTALGPTQPPIQWVPGALSLG